MEDHVYRTAKMGPWVLINDRWYKSFRSEWNDFDTQFLHEGLCFGGRHLGRGYFEERQVVTSIGFKNICRDLFPSVISHRYSFALANNVLVGDDVTCLGDEEA